MGGPDETQVIGGEEDMSEDGASEAGNDAEVAEEVAENPAPARPANMPRRVNR